MIDISIIIPLFNEEESLPELIKWIEKVMLQHQFTYEVWMVDDGSKDRSWDVIESLNQKNNCVKGIRFQRNYGKSAALYEGFKHANGRVVITMDADLQDSPDEIPDLYKKIAEEGYDLVSGWKQKRFDPITKTIPTKLYNWAARKMSGIYLHDFNCGLKSYHYRVVKSIEVYGEMHRYIPILAKWAGYTKITEKVVQHQARKYGTTKFGIERFVFGFLDLLSISFVSRFAKRPMHFFGAIGFLAFFLGFIMALYLGLDKLNSIYNGNLAPLVANSPFFYIALTMMVLGTQLFLAGFLGELISRSATNRNDYLIEKVIS